MDAWTWGWGGKWDGREPGGDTQAPLCVKRYPVGTCGTPRTLSSGLCGHADGRGGQREAVGVRTPDGCLAQQSLTALINTCTPV